MSFVVHTELSGYARPVSLEGRRSGVRADSQLPAVTGGAGDGCLDGQHCSNPGVLAGDPRFDPDAHRTARECYANKDTKDW